MYQTQSSPCFYLVLKPFVSLRTTYVKLLKVLEKCESLSKSLQTVLGETGDEIQTERRACDRNDWLSPEFGDNRFVVSVIDKSIVEGYMVGSLRNKSPVKCRGFVTDL